MGVPATPTTYILHRKCCTQIEWGSCSGDDGDGAGAGAGDDEDDNDDDDDDGDDDVCMFEWVVIFQGTPIQAFMYLSQVL